MNTQKSYSIKPSGAGKISAALAKLCADGKQGEALVRSGLSQANFGLFLAQLASDVLAQGKTVDDLAHIFALVSAGNASAAKQALAECILKWDGEAKEQSVSAYWETLGGSKGAPNLAALDDL